MAKLDVRAFGLALGIVWGIAVLLLGILAMLFNWGTVCVIALSTMYIGYKSTFLGSLVGGIWGFIDAGIAGVVIAWLYNKFAK